MGKKKSSGHGGGRAGGENGGEAEVVAREFVLKVAMHCRCHGCTDKVRGAVRDITQADGVEAFDSSAAESSGEVRLLATADPERLRRRLRRATGKKVDLLLPREPAGNGKEQGTKKADPLDDDAAALHALLASLQLQQGPAARQQYGGGHGAAAAWAANQQQQQQQLMGLGLGGGGWNGAGVGTYGAAYPWPAASSASSYYPAASTTGWGPYGYAPPAPAPTLGYYGGGAPVWHGY